MRRVILLVLFLLPASAGVAMAGVRHDLVKDAVTPPAQANRGLLNAAIRRRFVRVDLEGLAAPALKRGEKARAERSLGVTLFNDLWLPVLVDSVEKDGIGSDVWTGRVEGSLASTVTIAVTGDAMTATISTPDADYLIVPVNGGVHEVQEVDRRAFPAESEPITVKGESVVMAADAPMAGDEATRFDLLVAYTNLARQEQGGTSGIQSLISSAVNGMNMAFANSQVTARVRLVGTVELEYDDRTPTQTTLSRLRTPSDGFLDQIHTHRNDLGADAVSLIVSNAQSSCGVGYMMTSPSANFASYAFNVVVSGCAVGNFSLAHEFGHNFGLEHDRTNSGGAPSYPYAYGYQDTTQQFRDIMSYSCPSAYCPRIQHFSNPEVTYNGRPTGVHYQAANSADNARALNNNAQYVANWRQTVVPVTGGTTPTFTDDPLIPGVSMVKAVHITELRAAVNAARARAGLSAVTYSDSTLTNAPIQATHVIELRAALHAALAATGQTATFTDPTLNSTTPVRAVHIQELRNYTK